MRARTIGVIAFSLSLSGPLTARGQTADHQRDAAGQALYLQAKAEMQKRQYASACRKLEEVTRLVPEGIGAKMTLAQCYEGEGRLASAWSHYAIVAELAAKAGQKERAQKAAAKVSELQPKLATLAVEVPDEVRSIPGLAIERDGLALGEGQWRTPMPVDAGSHTIIATAPGRKAWTKRVHVAADGAEVLVRVGVPQAEAKVAVKPRLDAVPLERPWQRPLGIGAMGLGGAVVVTGAVLGGLAISKDAKSDEGYCNAQGLCDSESVRLSKEAVGFATASTVMIVAGGALFAGGIVLFATAPKAGSGEIAEARNGRRGARLEVGFGSLHLKGGW